MSNNVLFEWDKEFELGIEILDKQHKQLVDVINELYAGFRAGKADLVINQTLDKLILYTKYHFKAEEALMKEYDFPEYENHAKIHRAFENIVIKKTEEYKKGESRVHYDIMNFMKTWLVNHILKIDKEHFKDYNID